MRIFLFLLYAVSLLAPTNPLNAQQRSQDNSIFREFDEMFRRMEEQMRRGMPDGQQLKPGKDGSYFHMSPDSSSSFYFRVDTSFSGSGLDMLRNPMFNDPFFKDFFNGRDGFGGDMFNFDEFFRGFRDMTEGMERGQGDGQQLPPDDGAERRSEEELLPEERMRDSENDPPQPGLNQSQKQPVEKQTKKKMKTTRI